VTDVQAFLNEVVLTAVFLAVILTATRRTDANAPFAIPLTLAVIHFAGIPISGASVNPARALGPALVGGDLASIWIYLTAPFVGAVVGWGIFKLLDDDNGG
jgi:aquaporin Z